MVAAFVLVFGILAAEARAQESPSATALPSEVDLRPRLAAWGLSPRGQGARPTCSVFTVVQAIEAEIARARGFGVPVSVEFANWAANAASHRGDDGSFFHEIWAGYEAHGACPEELWPYGAAFDAAAVPTASAREAAIALKSAVPLRLHWIAPLPKRPGITRAHLDEIRRVLASGHVVCGGSSHSVLFVGYRDDPAAPGGGALRVRDSGGRGGEGEIDYAAALARFGDVLWIEAIPSGASKRKYGPQATLLRFDPAFIREAPAPDYWALSPGYASQRDDRSCSIASAVMVVNAARDPLALSADDELATQEGLLERLKDEQWRRAVGPMGLGVTLAGMRTLLTESLEAYGVSGTAFELLHADALEGPALRKRVHALLLENERSARDLVIANFNQGAFTGDADAGHIAPVGAYDAGRRRVLILDPDRRFYEPYWVSLETFVAGISTKDRLSGRSRGILRVRLAR